ncbi:hypothetical protein ZWY2020_028875 [Hordeum vulgare]|nr:hypothetical protein ZWY2020_028875 [Hordeum vulgare]
MEFEPPPAPGTAASDRDPSPLPPLLSALTGAPAVAPAVAPAILPPPLAISLPLPSSWADLVEEDDEAEEESLATPPLPRTPVTPSFFAPDRQMSEELMVYGHGIEGLAFFHMEIPDVPPRVPSLSAIVTVLGNGVASLEMIEADLNHIYRCEWLLVDMLEY